MCPPRRERGFRPMQRVPTDESRDITQGLGHLAPPKHSLRWVCITSDLLVIYPTESVRRATTTIHRNRW